MANELGLATQRALLVDERAVHYQNRFRLQARMKNALNLVENGILKDKDEATKPIQEALEVTEAHIMLWDKQIAEIDDKIKQANAKADLTD